MITLSRARRTGLAGISVAGLLALAACGGSADAADPAADAPASYGTIDVNLSWIKNSEFAGEYVADDRGYYAEAGIEKVNLIAGGPGGTSTESMVLSGGAMVGTSSPLGVAPVILEEEAPLKIIGTTYQKNPFTIVSLADNPISTPEDLKGKKIGVQSGVNETLFSALLTVNGIDPSELEIVPVQYDPAPLANGDVDGFMAYITNEAITLESQGHDIANLTFADNGLPFSAESFVTTDQHLAEDRDALKAFLLATLRGWTDAVADPEESARLAVEVYGTDLGLDMDKEIGQAEAQVDLISTPETEQNGLFLMTPDLIQRNIDVLKLAGYDVTADQMFDMSLMEEIYAEHPELT